MPKHIKGDVQWMLPKRKTPFAYSTKATSDLIVILAEKFNTIRQVREAIVYDNEAMKILDVYIEKGFGEQKASDFFK